MFLQLEGVVYMSYGWPKRPHGLVPSISFRVCPPALECGGQPERKVQSASQNFRRAQVGNYAFSECYSAELGTFFLTFVPVRFEYSDGDPDYPKT